MQATLPSARPPMAPRLQSVMHAPVLHLASSQDRFYKGHIQAQSHTPAAGNGVLRRQHLQQLQQQRQTALQQTAPPAAAAFHKKRPYSSLVSTLATARATGVSYRASSESCAAAPASTAEPSEAIGLELDDGETPQDTLATQVKQQQQQPAEGRAESRRVHQKVPTAEEEAATAAAAAAAERAESEGLAADKAQLTGVCIKAGPLAESTWQYTCRLAVATMSYTKSCASILEAACTYDLARRALYGPQYTVNFPPSVYTEADTDAVREHIRLQSPGMLDAAAAKSKGITDYQHAAVRRPADAAVAAAAQRAAANGHNIMTASKLRGVRQFSENAFAVEANIWTASGKVRLCWYYGTQLEAACASDLYQLARGRGSQLILPLATYTSEDVAAMQQWVQLDLARKVTAKGSSSTTSGSTTSGTRRYKKSDAVSWGHDPISAAAAQAAAAQAVASAADRIAAAGLANDIETVQPTGVKTMNRKSSPTDFLVTLNVDKQRHPMLFPDRLQAACAYDLARRVLRGPNFTVNFPPDMYTDVEHAAFKEYLHQAAPSLVKAATTAYRNKDAMRKRNIRYNYHQLLVVKAADAAVESAACAAAECGLAVDPANRHCYIAHQSGYEVRMHVGVKALKSMPRAPCAGKAQHVCLSCSSEMKAACAADMMRLAMGRSDYLNLPGELYDDQHAWVDAVREFLLLELQFKSAKS